MTSEGARWAMCWPSRRFILVGPGLSALGASLIGVAPGYWPLIGLLLIACIDTAAA